MKREIERKKKLPSFVLKKNEFEILWEKLLDLFDSEDVYSSFSINLPTEKLEFKNIDELKEYKELPDKVRYFSLYISDKNNTIYLTNASYSTDFADVRAAGESGAWCAGAIDTVVSYLNAYKCWYSWINSFPLGVFMFIFACMPILAKYLFDGYVLSVIMSFAWFLSLVFMMIIHCFKSILFPVGLIKVRSNENFVKKYKAELIVILTAMPTLLIIVDWFIK